MVKLYNEFKNRDLVVLAVDVQEKKEIVEKYARKEKLPFPVLLDKYGRVANDYGIKGHPAHFFINGSGELIGLAMGARDWTSTKSKNLIRFLIDQNKQGLKKSRQF